MSNIHIGIAILVLVVSLIVVAFLTEQQRDIEYERLLDRANKIGVVKIHKVYLKESHERYSSSKHWLEAQVVPLNEKYSTMMIFVPNWKAAKDGQCWTLTVDKNGGYHRYTLNKQVKQIESL